jgi:hypothetical protein
MISLLTLHRVLSIIGNAYAVPVSLIVNTKLHTPEARGHFILPKTGHACVMRACRVTRALRANPTYTNAPDKRLIP